MVRGNLSGLNLSATSPLLSVGVLVLIYELVVWTHWWDIFTPLLLHRLGEQRGRGASRHAFTVANRFSAQWQNLALGLRFHCVSVGGERLSMSQREREGRVHVRSLVCPRSALVWAMSSHFSKRLSYRPIRLWEMCSSVKKKNLHHPPYQWLIPHWGPNSQTPQWFSERHTQDQFLDPPLLWEASLLQTHSVWLSRKYN